MPLKTWIAALGSTLLLGTACGDDGPPAGDGSGTASTGPQDTGDSTHGASTTGPSLTEGTSTMGPLDGTTDGITDGETTAGATCDAPPVGEACQPPGRTAIRWAVRVDGVEVQEDEVLATCTLADLTDDGTTTLLSLDCTRFQAEIELETTGPHHVLELPPMASVELHASAGLVDEANVARYLTLRDTGLVLAAFDAPELAPPPSFAFDPVALEVVATDCPQQPTECVLTQDAALSVGFDDQTALVFGGQSAFVGQLTSYRALTGLVERAQCQPDDCGYGYAEWLVQAIVVRVPEG